MLPFFVSLALFLSAPASEHVRHFKKITTSQFPRTLLVRDFCDNDPDCWENFKEEGSVWVGDVNGDGINELLVFPGNGWLGSSGRSYFLYEKRGKHWVSLTRDPNSDDDEDGWFTLHPRFEILPAVHHGYHDLRVAAFECMKWDGKKYVAYDPPDYHSLNPAWFSNRDSRDAEILWAIHYAGRDKVIFTPQWFPITRYDFLTSSAQRQRLGRSDFDQLRRSGAFPERLVHVELKDPQERLRWYALYKGGVWAVRSNQAFFLAPQVSETHEFVEHLKIDGDWLLGSGGDRPNIRYNRRTHELILDPNDGEADFPDK